MTTEDINKRIDLYYRANEISMIYRKKYNMPRKSMWDSYICSTPDYQASINKAHCFNKYLKELRERYIQ